MPKLSNAWKQSEAQWAKTLNRYMIPAKRISRGDNFCKKVDDVRITEHPYIKSDSKYSSSGHATTKLLKTLKEKYVKSPGEFGILVTKGKGQNGQTCVVDDEIFAMILSYWLGYTTKEEALAIYQTKVK